MMDLDTIEEISREAGAKAAAEKREPFVIFSDATAEADIRHAPFLGDYTPPGWRLITANEAGISTAERGVYGHDAEGLQLFVDSSGLGSASEPALTIEEVVAIVSRVRARVAADGGTFGVGITSTGQFQVHLGLYVKGLTVRKVR